MSRFQINAKSFLLTYAQSSFDLHAYSDWARSIGANKGVVSSELHEDGSLHRHAILFFDEPFRSRDPSVFDFQGRHPNIIGRIRARQAAIEYVEKHRDFLRWGEWVEKTSWQEIVQLTDEDSVIDAIKTSYPREWVVNNRQITEYIERLCTANRAFTYVPEFVTFNVPTALATWVSDELRSPRPGRRKSLVLVSPSGYGKTEWARSLGRHHFYSGMVSFKDWFNSPQLEYVVFDDINWSNIEPFYKQWFGCQKEFFVTDKYMGKKKIILGVPLIYCVNECPPWNSWLETNCSVIYLNEKLF